jgi:hypothetical protein
MGLLVCQYCSRSYSHSIETNELDQPFRIVNHVPVITTRWSWDTYCSVLCKAVDQQPLSFKWRKKVPQQPDGLFSWLLNEAASGYMQLLDLPTSEKVYWFGRYYTAQHKRPSEFASSFLDQTLTMVLMNDDELQQYANDLFGRLYDAHSQHWRINHDRQRSRRSVRPLLEPTRPS